MGVLSDVLQRGSSSDDGTANGSVSNSLIRNMTECMGYVFASQPTTRSFWSRPQTRQAFNSIVSMVCDDRPKVRRAAQNAIARILGKGHAAFIGTSIFSSVESILSGIKRADSRKMMMVLPMVKDALPHLLMHERDADDGGSDQTKKGKRAQVDAKHSSAGKLIFALLQAQNIVGDTMFSSLVFKALRHSVNTTGADKDGKCPWSPELLNLCLIALLDLPPPLRHVQVVGAYLPLVADMMVAMHSYDSGISLSLLPSVILNIVAYFDSPQLEVLEGAAEAMARIFVHAVSLDELRITNENIMLRQKHGSGGEKPSLTASPLENVTSSVSNLFQPRYVHARSTIVPLVKGMFQHFQDQAFPLLTPLVLSIASVLDTERAIGSTGNDEDVEDALWEMVKANEDDSDDDSSDEEDDAARNKNHYNEKKNRKRQKERAKDEEHDAKNDFDRLIGAIIQGYGCSNFLTTVAIGNPNAEGTQEVEESLKTLDRRLWLLPLLKKYLKDIGTPLGLFRDYVMAVALQCERASKAENVTNAVQGVMQTRVQQMWTLFPSFASLAIDTHAAFRELGPMLGNALRDPRYPRLQASVCMGLTALCTEYRFGSEDQKTQALENVLGSDKEKMKAGRQAIERFAPNFLPILFAGFEASNSHLFLQTIEAYILVSPESLVETMGKQVLKKLIHATMDLEKESNIQNASVMLGLSCALAPKMSASQQSVLYRAIAPCLEDRSPTVSKRAYRVLGALCEHHSKAAAAENFQWLQDIAKSVIGGINKSSVAGKRQRLICVGHIVNGLDLQVAEQQQLFLESLGEVVLCLKEQNTRARQAAFDCLFAMGEAMSKINMLKVFFDMVSAGLAGKTPHFRSATVTALSRLYYKYSKFIEDEATEALVSTVCLLFASKAREEITSLISFLVEIMVSRCGIEHVRAIFPEEDQGLINHIEKESRKKAKHGKKHYENLQNQREDRKLQDLANEKHAKSSLSWNADLQTTFSLASSDSKQKKRTRSQRDDIKYDKSGKMIVEEEGNSKPNEHSATNNRVNFSLNKGIGVIHDAGEEETAAHSNSPSRSNKRARKEKKNGVVRGKAGGQEFAYVKFGKDFQQNWKESRRGKKGGKGGKRQGKKRG
eukprot:g1833.t1